MALIERKSLIIDDKLINLKELSFLKVVLMKLKYFYIMASLYLRDQASLT